MADNATRSGTGAKLAGKSITLSVAASVAEIKTRLATPAHAPGTGPAATWQAFDVSDASGIHSVAVDVTGGMVS
jgi:hypothetical protein